MEEDKESTLHSPPIKLSNAERPPRYFNWVTSRFNHSPVPSPQKSPPKPVQKKVVFLPNSDQKNKSPNGPGPKGFHIERKPKVCEGQPLIIKTVIGIDSSNSNKKVGKKRKLGKAGAITVNGQQTCMTITKSFKVQKINTTEDKNSPVKPQPQPKPRPFTSFANSSEKSTNGQKPFKTSERLADAFKDVFFREECQEQDTKDSQEFGED